MSEPALAPVLTIETPSPENPHLHLVDSLEEEPIKVKNETTDYVRSRHYINDYNIVLFNEEAYETRKEAAEERLIGFFDYLLLESPEFAEVATYLLDTPPTYRERSDKNTYTAFSLYRASPSRAYNRFGLIMHHRIEYGHLADIVDGLLDHIPFAKDAYMVVFEFFEYLMMRSEAITAHVYRTSFTNDWYSVVIREGTDGLVMVDYRPRHRL